MVRLVYEKIQRNKRQKKMNLCWNYGSLLEWWLYYWNGGYTIENVAHYWNGGYTIEKVAHY